VLAARRADRLTALALHPPDSQGCIDSGITTQGYTNGHILIRTRCADPLMEASFSVVELREIRRRAARGWIAGLAGVPTCLGADTLFTSQDDVGRRPTLSSFSQRRAAALCR
jgi:hypothetical protein